MKIRTDFVTNSSSSSFVLTLLVETTNGKRIAFQGIAGEDQDYPSLSAYTSPKDLGQCDSVEALAEMLKNSVCAGDDFPILEGSAFLGKVEKIHSMDDISRITIEGYEHGGWTDDGEPYAIENRATYDLKSHEYKVVCRGLYDEIECDVPSGELGFSFEGAEVTRIEEAPDDIDKKTRPIK